MLIKGGKGEFTAVATVSASSVADFKFRGKNFRRGKRQAWWCIHMESGRQEAADGRLPSTVFCAESLLSIPRPLKRHLVCCLPSAGVHVFSNLQSFISLSLNVIILHLQQKWALGTTVHRPQRWQGWGPLCPEPPALSGPPRPISPTRWWLLRWTWLPPGSAPRSSASRPLAEEKRRPVS